MSMRPATNSINYPVQLYEDMYGRTRQDIWYPNISSCITITFATGGYYFGGVHITVLTTSLEIQKALQAIMGYQQELSPTSPYTNCYVTGAVGVYINATKVPELKSPGGITQFIRTYAGWKNSVAFYDTAFQRTGYDAEVHVFTEAEFKRPMSYFRPANKFDQAKSFSTKPTSRTFITSTDFIYYN